MTSTMATYFEYCHTLESWLIKRKVTPVKAKDLVASLMFGLSHSMLLSKTKTKNLVSEMEADPDDLPRIEDIHGNEYDPKQVSDEQHDFTEDEEYYTHDLPDGIEIG